MTSKIIFLFLGLIVMLTVSCKKGDKDVDPLQDPLSKPVSNYTSAMLNEYASLQLKLVSSTPGYETPVAARSMAYMALAAYEAAVPGMIENKSLSGELEGFANLPVINEKEEYHWPIAVNAAEHTLMKKLYATSGDVFKIKMDTLKKKYDQFYRTGVGSDVIDRSVRFGQDIAQAVWIYSQTDGGHEAYNNNFPISNSTFKGAAVWQPTGEESRPLLPKWGEVRMFVLANKYLEMPQAKEFSFQSNTPFFEEANDVYLTNKTLNSTQKEIMAFWEMPKGSVTQAGNQLALVSNLINKENYTLDRALLLYLKVTMAMHDALVVSWKNKFANNLMRPITYINQAIDPKWKPNHNASPVPDFTSEQATLVSAVSGILAYELGETYVFEVTSQYTPSLKRGYKTFSSYAKEAQVAPIYSGIHYRMSTVSGALQGLEIANNTWNLDLKAAAKSDSTSAVMPHF